MSENLACGHHTAESESELLNELNQEEQKKNGYENYQGYQSDIATLCGLGKYVHSVPKVVEEVHSVNIHHKEEEAYDTENGYCLKYVDVLELRGCVALKSGRYEVHNHNNDEQSYHSSNVLCKLYLGSDYLKEPKGGEKNEYTAYRLGDSGVSFSGVTEVLYERNESYYKSYSGNNGKNYSESDKSEVYQTEHEVGAEALSYYYYERYKRNKFLGLEGFAKLVNAVFGLICLVLKVACAVFEVA